MDDSEIEARAGGSRGESGWNFPRPIPWPGLSIYAVFNSLALIVIVRTVFEILLEEHTLSRTLDFYEVLVAYTHIYISWMCLFVAFALLTALFLQVGLSVSLRMVLLFSPIIITVPFVDYLLVGGREIKYGESFSDLLYNFANLFNPAASITMVTPGVRLEVLLVTAGGFLVGWLYFRKTLLRALGFAFSLYATIFIFGYLPALMPALHQELDLVYFPVYLPVFFILMALVAIRLRMENRNWGRPILHLLYPSRLFFYILLIAFGMVFTAKKSGLYPSIFSTRGVISLLLATTSVSLLFMHAKIRNDVHDRDIDRISNPQRPVIPAIMAPEDAQTFGAVFLLPSFAFGLAAERHFFLFWLLIFALSTLYSEPPMRLRRFYPLGHYALSLVGTSVFMSGALLAGSRDFFLVNDVPKLTGLVFVSCFFLSHIKDFKDVEGDRSGGVMNVYNLTRFPRIVGAAAVCGFACGLIFTLPLLGINGWKVFLVIGAYLATALTAIARTADLRRLDWIIPLSMGLVVYVSIVWLSKG
jgi:4-hydroxybenzoate polyprenyltransferase